MNITDWLSAINSLALSTGLITGALVSAAYFAGLAFGIRHALAKSLSVLWILVSALLRIAVLIGIGWVLSIALGGWAAVGYASAFICVRTIAIALAHKAPPNELPSCN